MCVHLTSGQGRLWQLPPLYLHNFHPHLLYFVIYLYICFAYLTLYLFCTLNSTVPYSPYLVICALRRGRGSTHMGDAPPPQGSRPGLVLVSMWGRVQDWHAIQHFTFFSMPYILTDVTSFDTGDLTSNVLSHANVRCVSLANSLHWLMDTPNLYVYLTWGVGDLYQMCHMYIKCSTSPSL